MSEIKPVEYLIAYLEPATPTEEEHVMLVTEEEAINWQKTLTCTAFRNDENALRAFVSWHDAWWEPVDGLDPSAGD